MIALVLYAAGVLALAAWLLVANIDRDAEDRMPAAGVVVFALLWPLCVVAIAVDVVVNRGGK